MSRTGIGPLAIWIIGLAGLANAQAEADRPPSLSHSLTATSLAGLKEEQAQFVRTNLDREDLRAVLNEFEHKSGMRLDTGLAVALLTEYLVAEHAEQSALADTNEARDELRRAGRRALLRHLKEAATADELIGIRALLANELGNRGLFLRKRSRYGRLQISSKPAEAEVSIDSSEHSIGVTPVKVVALEGVRRVQCKKANYEPVTHEVRVEPNGNHSVNCALPVSGEKQGRPRSAGQRRSK